jgi:hypothetical protein
MNFDQQPRCVIGIDPGSKSGIAVFSLVERNGKVAFILQSYGWCSPADTKIIQECLVDIENKYARFVSSEIEMAIENQHGGKMSAGTFASLVRTRERWQCLAEARGIKVTPYHPRTWQSWAYDRTTPDDAKQASCDRVKARFGVDIDLDDEKLSNAADAINIGDCHIKGFIHEFLEHNPSQVNYRPRYKIDLTITTKPRSGQGLIRKRQMANIIRAKATFIEIETTDGRQLHIPLPRITTRRKKRGMLRLGGYTYTLDEAQLSAFEDFIEHTPSWPA